MDDGYRRLVDHDEEDSVLYDSPSLPIFASAFAPFPTRTESLHAHTQSCLTYHLSIFCACLPIFVF